MRLVRLCDHQANWEASVSQGFQWRDGKARRTAEDESEGLTQIPTTLQL